MTENRDTTQGGWICPRCEGPTENYALSAGQAYACDACQKRMETCVTYLAIGLYCWGRGTTPEEAKANCRKASSHPRRKWRGILKCITGDDQPYVNEMGETCYYGSCLEVERVAL